MMRKFIILLALGAVLFSCKKETDFYKAEIRIINEDGIPIQNSFVRLTVPNIEKNTLIFEGYTGIDGVIKFEIDNKAYYDVKTWKGNWRACNFIEFEKNKTVTKDIIIRKWADPYNGCIN